MLKPKQLQPKDLYGMKKMVRGEGTYPSPWHAKEEPFDHPVIGRLLVEFLLCARDCGFGDEVTSALWALTV